MKILVINSGSSSIKFQLVDKQDLSPVVDGILERIGTKHSQCSYSLYNESGIHKKIEEPRLIKSHTEGFKLLIDFLRSRMLINDPTNLAVIGHRVVHGGERFKQPALITESVIDAIHENIPLAPEHNPANLAGIEICRETFPSIPQVAVFDTAFHQTIPTQAFRYPLPESLYKDHKIRRYGFHGNSHHYVAHCAARVLGKPISQLNLITLHLGNGASAAAIQGGRCVDTSMGMTPLEGLMMGTRSGDIDPAIIFYLARNTGLDLDEIDTLLNRKSGLSGICGSNDMREIQQRADQGDKLAKLAIEMYCYRIKNISVLILPFLNGLMVWFLLPVLARTAPQFGYKSVKV
jgi:acetate kinase